MKNIKKILLSIATVSLMTGCASSVGPKAKEGALIGAGTGAVVAAVTDNSIVTGAVVGAAVGGGLGHLQE